MTVQLKAKISAAIEDIDSQIELVGVHLRPKGRRMHVTVRVDRPGGIDLEQLTQINRHLTADLEDDFDRPYLLEVSSAGVERPLSTPEHYSRFQGKKVKLLLHKPRGSTAVIVGHIARANSHQVTIHTETGAVDVPFDTIKRANLVFEL